MYSISAKRRAFRTLFVENKGCHPDTVTFRHSLGRLRESHRRCFGKLPSPIDLDNGKFSRPFWPFCFYLFLFLKCCWVCCWYFCLGIYSSNLVLCWGWWRIPRFTQTIFSRWFLCVEGGGPTLSPQKDLSTINISLTSPEMTTSGFPSPEKKTWKLHLDNAPRKIYIQL